MIMETRAGIPVDSMLVRNYFEKLVNKFYKILPLKESNESSLRKYLQSLSAELLGFKSLLVKIDYDSQFMTLLCVLQYITNTPDCTVGDVKREVFKAISVCNKLADKYGAKE